MIPAKDEPNGCGGKGDKLDPPELRFGEACDEHDLAYGFGGTERDRRIADRDFLRNMQAKAACAPLAYRPFYHGAAVGYWAAVRLFGWRKFNYRKGK